MPEVVSIAELRELLAYGPETGHLIWRPRSPHHFKGEQQSNEHSCKIWNARNAGQPAFTATNGNGYRHGAVFGRTLLAHRVAWAIHFGMWPELGIDHINGNRADNRIENMRDVPGSENAKNQKRRVCNSSGVTGVSYFARTKKWVAMIKGDGKVRNLGYFHTIQEAAAARKAADKKFGFHPNHGRSAA